MLVGWRLEFFSFVARCLPVFLDLFSRLLPRLLRLFVPLLAAPGLGFAGSGCREHLLGAGCWVLGGEDQGFFPGGGGEPVVAFFLHAIEPPCPAGKSWMDRDE